MRRRVCACVRVPVCKDAERRLPTIPPPEQMEEEDYTSRIIHYFNVGLLQLPDGQTLRAYISKKLK